jgi:hypothetical protein
MRNGFHGNTVTKMAGCLLAMLGGCSALVGQAPSPPPTFGGIHLLDGYSAQRKWAVDVAAWQITGPHHFVINFEAGDESWVDPKDAAQYGWLRETTFRGHSVRLALVKTGLKTQWEPEHDRGLPPGNILLVTYVLWPAAKLYPEHAANFSAKVANPEELADALLMILSFDPSEGSF